MFMQKSLYDLLALDPGCTPAALRKALQLAAFKHHPDKGGDQAVFVEGRQAFEGLTTRRAGGERRPGVGGGSKRPG